MLKEIHTDIVIKATPEKIWKVLTDFGNYPDWNPFIRSIEGTVARGNQISVRITPPGARGMTIKPKVLRFDSNKELRWLGHLIIPGLFDGEHIFKLTDNGNGTTTFIQSERFGGILVPLFRKLLDKNTRDGFILMNKKLKELAAAEQM